MEKGKKMIRTKRVGNVKVSLNLTVDQGLSIEDGGEWVLICESHGGLIQDTNKNRLWGWSNKPDVFCQGCQNELVA
jgi:hypothetical protein